MRTSSTFNLICRAENQARLQKQQGKSGFGSSDYYGETEQPSGSSERRQSVENVMGIAKEGAQDFAQKFAGQAQEDYETIRKLVTTGGSKLADLLGDIQTRYGG